MESQSTPCHKRTMLIRFTSAAALLAMSGAVLAGEATDAERVPIRAERLNAETLVPVGCRGTIEPDAEPYRSPGPTRVNIVDTSEQFEELFGCKAPPHVDFSRQRVVAYTYVRVPAESYLFEKALDDGSTSHLYFKVASVRQGVRQFQFNATTYVILPKSTHPVEIHAAEEPLAPPDAVVPSDSTPHRAPEHIPSQHPPQHVP